MEFTSIINDIQRGHSSLRYIAGQDNILHFYRLIYFIIPHEWHTVEHILRDNDRNRFQGECDLEFKYDEYSDWDIKVIKRRYDEDYSKNFTNERGRMETELEIVYDLFSNLYNGFREKLNKVRSFIYIDDNPLYGGYSQFIDFLEGHYPPITKRFKHLLVKNEKIDADYNIVIATIDKEDDEFYMNYYRKHEFSDDYFVNTMHFSTYLDYAFWDRISKFSIDVINTEKYIINKQIRELRFGEATLSVPFKDYFGESAFTYSFIWDKSNEIAKLLAINQKELESIRDKLRMNFTLINLDELTSFGNVIHIQKNLDDKFPLLTYQSNVNHKLPSVKFEDIYEQYYGTPAVQLETIEDIEEDELEDEDETPIPTNFWNSTTTLKINYIYERTS